MEVDRRRGRQRLKGRDVQTGGYKRTKERS